MSTNGGRTPPAAEIGQAGPQNAPRRAVRDGVHPLRLTGRAVVWLAGMGVATVRWLRRLPRINRMELDDLAQSALPTAADRADQQAVDDGVGPLLHRMYRVRIGGARCSPAELLDRVASDLNAVSPREVAWFEKTLGGDELRVGDEYVVHMPGPWEGPLRVVDRDAVSFRFVTLRGHMEAGTIRFSVRRERAHLVFEIHSAARAGDSAFQQLYERLGVAREMQAHMWVHVCERVSEVARGRVLGQVDVATGQVHRG